MSVYTKLFSNALIKYIGRDRNTFIDYHITEYSISQNLSNRKKALNIHPEVCSIHAHLHFRQSHEAIPFYTSYSRRVIGPPLSSHHIVISHSANQTQESTQSVHLRGKAFVRVYLHPLPSICPPPSLPYTFMSHMSLTC